MHIFRQTRLQRYNFEIQSGLFPLMPDEDNTFGGSLVLEKVAILATGFLLFWYL